MMAVPARQHDHTVRLAVGAIHQNPCWLIRIKLIVAHPVFFVKQSAVRSQEPVIPQFAPLNYCSDPSPLYNLQTDAQEMGNI
jgi:hypothetical protein